MNDLRPDAVLRYTCNHAHITFVVWAVLRNINHLHCTRHGCPETLKAATPRRIGGGVWLTIFDNFNIREYEPVTGRLTILEGPEPY